MMRFGQSFPRAVFTAITAGVFFLVLGACAPRPTGLDERAGPSGEEAFAGRIRADLGYLDGPEPEGRGTATRGFTRAATYLAGQMRNSGLHPVQSGEYRMQYAARIRRSLETRILWLGTDTTRAVAGTDYLIVDPPVAISESGPLDRLPHFPWIVWNDKVDAGRDPATRWSMHIQVQEQSTTAPMHVGGMIPGAHPVQRDSLVIWIAPVDGTGLQGVQSWTDGSDLAIPAAAVLAAMRQVSGQQDSWAAYPQTIMVAFLSGTRTDCSGPDMFFRHLPWDRALVSRVLVAEMDGDHGCDWEGLWNQYADIASGPRIRVLDAYAPFSANADLGFEAWRPRSRTQRPELLNAATSEALRLAREIVRWVP